MVILLTVCIKFYLLTTGPVCGLFDGKHFNQCKRLYPLLATALQLFIEEQGPLTDVYVARLNNFAEVPSSESLSSPVESEVLSDLLEQCGYLSDCTRSGIHGYAAKFWLVCIDLVHIYLIFDRACRTNGVSLHLCSKYDAPSIFCNT